MPVTVTCVLGSGNAEPKVELHVCDVCIARIRYMALNYRRIRSLRQRLHYGAQK